MNEAQHVETVKLLYAAMGRPGFDASGALLAEDVEIVVPGRAGLGAAQARPRPSSDARASARPRKARTTSRLPRT